MTYEIINHAAIGSIDKPEKSVRFITDEDEKGNTLVVTVHPWDRSSGHRAGLDHDRSVFVSVGWQTPEGEDLYDEESGETYMYNSITDREEFVRGLIEVFPEIQRAETA